jgi:transposase
MWALKGITPTAPSNREYKWVYLYGFVKPNTGETSFCILPTVNNRMMTMALEEFQKDVDPEQKILHIVIIDGAGFHSRNGVKFPDNIIPFRLPAYSPELQPAEKVWPIIKEALSNETFRTIDALEQTLITRCQYVQEHPQEVQAVTQYHWWPKDPVCI